MGQRKTGAGGETAAKAEGAGRKGEEGGRGGGGGGGGERAVERSFCSDRLRDSTRRTRRVSFV